MGQILVTGAAGFVGRHVVQVLSERGVKVLAVGRSRIEGPPRVASREVSISLATDWRPHLEDVDAVVHLADGLNRLERQEHRQDEALGETLIAASAALAEAAARAGIPAFLHLSSVKAVAGEAAARPLDETTRPAPTSLYGRCKLQLERILTDSFANCATRLVILRTPVLYGPGGRGSFARLVRLADTRLPLPYNSATRRSTLFVGNLADAIATVLAEPEAEGVFFLHDRPLMTLKEVLGTLRQGVDRSPNMLPVPRLLWSAAMRAPTPVKAVAQRLGGSLVVSDARFVERFNWQPPVATGDALLLTARARRSAGGGERPAAEDETSRAMAAPESR